MKVASLVSTTVLLGVIAANAPVNAEDNAELAKRLTDAKAAYQELLSSKDNEVPQALLKNARCIAVIPHVVNGAFIYGARGGHGVMTCRDANGAWSAPSFVSLKGGSVGPQIGASTTDIVMFFMTEKGAQSLMTSSKFTLGGEASVAAGPFGRHGEAATDLKLNAEIYSYAKSKGLYAGLAVDGTRLAAEDDDNATFYGKKVTVKQLLFDHNSPSMPTEAYDFLHALP